METAIIEFINIRDNRNSELEVPLSITANDLIEALNDAYNLGMSRERYDDYYLCMENPIAFFRGERTLENFGIRNGSILIFKR